MRKKWADGEDIEEMIGASLSKGAYDDVCGAQGILLDECVSVWTIPSVLRYFYLL